MGATLRRCGPNIVEFFNRHLGIQQYEIDNAFEDYPNKSIDACHRLFTKWIRSQPDSVYFNILLFVPS